MRQLIVLAALVAGCGSNENTYVALQIDRGDLVGDVITIALDFSMPGKHATATLGDPGGTPIELPTSASFQLDGGGGLLTVIATAMNGTTALGSGSTTMQIPSGTTTPLDVSFGSVVGPTDDLGLPDLLGRSPDLAPSPRALTVQLTTVAGASGVVNGVSTPSQSDIACGSSCMETYSEGTTVILTPRPSPGFYFGGWSGDCATSALSLTCTVSMTADRQVGASFTPANVAFTTASPSPLPAIAAFGTGATMTAQVLSGADAICAAEASKATLPGHFVAWLSSSTSLAPARLKAGNPSNTAPQGWIRTDGKPFLGLPGYIGEPNDFHVYYPLALTAMGSVPTGFGDVWTGTNADGTLDSETCSDWTVTTSAQYGGTGGWSAGGRGWSSGDAVQCNAAAELYCFQVDYVAVVVPPSPPPQYKWAFGTKTTFDPSTGLAAADARCDAEAMAAHLGTTTGSFTALLAPTGMTPASRFTPGGALPYMRSDNVIVVDKDSDLFVPSPNPEAAIYLSADGTSLAGTSFLGAANLTSTANQNCNGWASNTSAFNSEILDDDSTNLTGFLRDCSQQAGLICLQK